MTPSKRPPWQVYAYPLVHGCRPLTVAHSSCPSISTDLLPFTVCLAQQPYVSESIPRFPLNLPPPRIVYSSSSNTNYSASCRSVNFGGTSYYYYMCHSTTITCHPQHHTLSAGACTTGNNAHTRARAREVYVPFPLLFSPSTSSSNLSTYCHILLLPFFFFPPSIFPPCPR